MYPFKFLVVDGDDRWCVHILTQHVGLLQADVRPKSLQAWENLSIRDCRFFSVCEVTAVQLVKSISLIVSRSLAFALSLAML